MSKIESSELIINPDGSIYHLHLRPQDIADTILLVGDPGRVEMISKHFSSIDIKIINREFCTHTGYYNGKRITALSTGIGTDNIDIVLNELDALVNIDFETRIPKKEHTTLNLIRLGTSGGLQANVAVDSFLVSEKAIGFDGLLNFYAQRNEVVELDFEKSFTEFVGWNSLLPSPYVVSASSKLLEKLKGNNMSGVTISAPGFYGPQGRVLRLPIIDPEINNKIEKFVFNSKKITNYEMESSALFGLSKLLGHEALTICVIIANRVNKTFSKDYKPKVEALIKYTLDKLTE
ncbi:MAG: nucleoside phosphorylase [Bacteroidales bacterium]|nr:nucleoside phosphorylase [Bacteroidales bacterium]